MNRNHEVWHDTVINAEVISHLEGNIYEAIHRQHLRNWCLEEFAPYSSVLEVGCGPGLVAEELMPHFLYTGVDNSRLMLDYAQEKNPDFNLAFGDAYDLVFADNFFDHVISFAVLGHLPADSINQPLAEMCRVARNSVLFTAWDRPLNDGHQDVGNAIHNAYSEDYLRAHCPSGTILSFVKDFGVDTFGYRIGVNS